MIHRQTEQTSTSAVASIEIITAAFVHLSSSGYVRLTELAKVEFQNMVVALRCCLFLCGNNTQSRGESSARRSPSKARVVLCRQARSSERSISSCGKQTVMFSFSESD